MQATARASDYVLEQRTQKRYRQLLRDSAPDNEAWDSILEQCFPKHFSGSHRDRCQVYWQAEDRAEHEVPEVITRLCRADLEKVAALVEQTDLIGCIRLVWEVLRPQLHKTAPAQPRLPDDAKQHQAAGFGRPRPTKKPAPRKKPKPAMTPLGPPLVLTPPPPVQRAVTPKPAVCRVPARPRLRVQGGRQLSLWPPAEHPFRGGMVGV